MADEYKLPYTAEEVVNRLAAVINKLDKNLGSEYSGKVAGINSAGDIVPMFAPGFKFNETTQCIEYVGTELALDDSIKLDPSLSRSDFAADAKIVGDKIIEIKNELSKKQPAGDYATKTEAQNYANAKDNAIAEAKQIGTENTNKIKQLESTLNSLGLSVVDGLLCVDVEEV